MTSRCVDHPSPPLVSVVIPLYNHESFVIQCLESILEDPYPSKEVLVVDDGSNDNSFAMVQQWFAMNGRQLRGYELRKRENSGICRTLNELVSMASGEFIIPLASDDFLLPGGISARVDYLLKHPEKLAVFADSITVDENAKVLCGSCIEEVFHGRKKYLSDDFLLSYELLFHWCIPGPVFAARRNAYDIVGFYNEASIVEDWDFYLRIMGHNNALGFINHPVAAYRMHSRNFSKRLDKHESFRSWPLDGINRNIQYFSGIKRFRLNAMRMKNLGIKAINEGKVFSGLNFKMAGLLLTTLAYAFYEIAFIKLKLFRITAK